MTPEDRGGLSGRSIPACAGEPYPLTTACHAPTGLSPRVRGNLGQQCSHGSRPLALAAPIRLYRSQPVTRRPRTGAERPAE